MENIDNHIDDLIGKYLSGEATPEEIHSVKTWVSASEGNEKYFDQIKMIFTRAATVEVQLFNTDAAWNNVKEKLQKKQTKTVQLTPEHKGYGLLLRIAASIIIILSIGFFTYQKFNKSSTDLIEVIAKNKTEADTFPDGSGVFLNKETKLLYSFNKKKNTHVVNMKGEAYFNIKHHDDKKFIVTIDDVFIKDIGTSFNVKAYPESNTIEVVVEEGEVMFYTEKDSGVYLKANGKGIYNKLTKKFTVEQAQANVTAYKTKFFIFTDTDLLTVVKTINEVYNQKISISPNLYPCRLTATFNNESIDEIASVIAETLALTVKKSDQQISLEGSGCVE